MGKNNAGVPQVSVLGPLLFLIFIIANFDPSETLSTLAIASVNNGFSSWWKFVMLPSSWMELGVASLVFVLFFLHMMKPALFHSSYKTPPSKVSTIQIFQHTANSLLTGAEEQKLQKTIPVLHKSHQFNKDSPIACLTFKGRLGNIIMQYAFLYIISKLKGLYPVIPENFQLLNIFEINKTTLSAIGKSQKECNKVKVYKERWPCSFDQKIMEVPAGKSAKFDGFFQSWKYWISDETEMRKVFTFKRKIREKVSEQFSEILKKFHYKNSPDDVIVSIHARRGDYLSEPERNVGRLAPNVSYYINAMDYYRKRYKHVYFIMASDGIDWAKKYLGNQPYIHFSEGNSAAEDIALMSKANHSIISVGTFGWVIGWLTGGTTIYYEKLFVPGSRYSRNFKNSSKSEYVYPGWIAMM